MVDKRRRSVLEDPNDPDGTNHTINPSRVIVCARFNHNDTVATSSQPRVPDDLTTSLSLSPPQKKLKRKSTTRRGSNSESSTFVKQAAISGRTTRASFVSVSNTSLRSATGISPRMSARLAKKIHPFILTKSRDIYPYLASKDSLDSAESLQEEHGGTRSSTPSASTLKKRKGPLRNINLADDDAKAALMEEWVNLRMSQGTLLSSMRAGRDTMSHLSSNCGSQEPFNEAEIPSGEVAEPNKPHPAPANDDVEHTHPQPSGSLSNQVAEPLPNSDMPTTNEFTPALLQSEGLAPHNSSPDHDLRYPSSSPENVHPVIGDIAPSQYVNEGTMGTIPQVSHIPVINYSEVVNQPLQLLATDGKITTLHPPSSPMLSKLDILPETMIPTSPAAPAKPEGSSARTSAVDIELVVSSQADFQDVVLGFHMLDLHEVLSPWVPASPTAPSIYVPPAVQHLIAAMNRQLEYERQARKRAEELYLDEMRKRIKMEEAVDRLQRERGQEQEQEQEQEQGASRQPPSLDASPPAASAHTSPEESGQRDDEVKPTSTDTIYPNVTTEGACA